MSDRTRIGSIRPARAASPPAPAAAEALESRVLLATAGGVVFHDLDNDGVRDAGEPGVANRRVYQDLNNNGAFDAANEPDVLTDGVGAYTLQLFPPIFGPGTARIRQVVPAGWTATAPSGGLHLFSYHSNSVVTGLDFGVIQNAVAPSNVVAVQRALGIRVMFTDHNLNETEFIIQRKRAADPVSAYAEIGRVAGGTRYGNRVGFTGLGGVVGETYHYRVYAVNPTGTSLPSGPGTITVGAQPAGTGAAATWYDEQFFAGAPLTPDVPVDADLYLPYGPATGTPDPRIGQETFSGVLTAVLRPEFTEDYTFFSASDDGIDLVLVDPASGRVLLNGPPNGINLLRAMNPAEGFQDTHPPVRLTAGRDYLLRWRLNENTGDAGYRIGWYSPSVAQEVVPAELMTPTRLAPGYLQLMPCGDEVVLTFLDLSVSAAGTEVQRATGPDGPFETVATIPAPGAAAYRSFVDDGAAPYPLVPGETYYYRLRSTMYGEQSQPSAPVAVTLGADPTRLALHDGAAFLPGTDGDPATPADNALQLTPNSGYVRGAAFTTQGWDLDEASRGTNGGRGFSASFDFTVPARSAPPADGFAFVLQRQSPAALGEVGNGLGYQGLAQSLALKFDYYVNATPPTINRTGLYANGYMDDAGFNLPFSFAGGDAFRVDVSYDAAARTLFQRVSSLTNPGAPAFQTTYALAATAPVQGMPVDLAGILGHECAYVGFTGATGGFTADQRITRFSINGVTIPLREVSPPKVTQVYVSGSKWSAPFKARLESTGMGSGRFGYALGSGSAQVDELPWANIDQVTVRFDRLVRVEPGHLRIAGARVAGYPADAGQFTYDPATHSATWRLAAGRTFANDRLLIALDGGAGGVTGDDVLLDGEWVNPDGPAPGGAYPSGNGTPGGHFRFNINVLPADATRDGSVGAADVLAVRARQNTSTTRPGVGSSAYSVFHDLDGSGAINAVDGALARMRLRTVLPPAPGAAGAGGAPAVLRTSPTHRDLFAPAPVVT